MAISVRILYAHAKIRRFKGSFALGDDDGDKFDTKWIYLCRREWNALLQMGMFALGDNNTATSNYSVTTLSCIGCCTHFMMITMSS